MPATGQTNALAQLMQRMQQTGAIQSGANPQLNQSLQGVSAAPRASEFIHSFLIAAAPAASDKLKPVAACIPDMKPSTARSRSVEQAARRKGKQIGSPSWYLHFTQDAKECEQLQRFDCT